LRSSKLLLLLLPKQLREERWALRARCCGRIFAQFITLIHDDIEDDSPIGMGPDVWKSLGRRNAINAGACLISNCTYALQRLRVAPEIALKAWAIFNRNCLD